eukprot:426088-Pelagomonas_calceolata.AAC.1
MALSRRHFRHLLPSAVYANHVCGLSLWIMHAHNEHLLVFRITRDDVQTGAHTFSPTVLPGGMESSRCNQTPYRKAMCAPKFWGMALFSEAAWFLHACLKEGSQCCYSKHQTCVCYGT